MVISKIYVAKKQIEKEKSFELLNKMFCQELFLVSQKTKVLASSSLNFIGRQDRWIEKVLFKV